ncbi:MAG: LCP family protein [Actinomycetota bacterium]
MNDFSNLEAMGTGGKPPRSGFSWRRFGKYLGIFVVVIAVLAGGTAFYVYKYVDKQFKNGNIGGLHLTGDNAGKNLPAAVELKHSVNILVLGSDSRDVLDPTETNMGQFRKDGTDGQRSDTIILIHLTDGGRKAITISFPRDLRVKIHGHSGYSKINGAYNSGANTVIQTITDLTGLKIDHYVDVNFTSFRKIVKALGGVRMCVDRTYADRRSGLYVQKPGCYNFDGNKALAFVRMRYQDAEGDFGRIKRQQYFMRTVLTKMKNIGFLANIPAVLDLADAVGKGVKHDSDLSLGLVRTISEKLAGFGAANVDFRTVPSHPEYIGGGAYVIADEPAATQLYTALKNDTPLPNVGKNSLSIPIPSDVTLDLRNASGIKGVAGVWETKLKTAGYVVRKVETAKKPRSQTQVAFRPGSEAKAELLAKTFTGAQIVPSVNLPHNVDCVVLIGKDHAPEAMPSASPAAVAP